MGVTYWNKVIDLEFLDANKLPVSAIKCPRFGRKPSIEVTGELFPTLAGNGFNVAVKNLYLDNIMRGAQKIRMTAGYAGSEKLSLEGDICYIHQESPAPEGKTIIQCMPVSIASWVTKAITLNFDKGYTLESALSRISKELGFKKPIISPNAMQLTSNEALQFQGTCQNALERLKQSFSNVQLANMGDVIQAYIIGDTDGMIIHDIPFLSAPPEIKAGTGSSISGATVTALWNPSLKPGDIIRFNTNFYQSALYLKSLAQEKTTLQISQLSFHFATIGSINQMTIAATPATQTKEEAKE